VGEEHIVTFGECASFTFRRVRDPNPNPTPTPNP